MKRRVFIALMASLKLQKWVAEMRPRFDSLPIQWVLGKNLHMTFVPPWKEENVEGVMKIMNSFQLGGPFTIKLNNLEFGPDAKRPRILWLRAEPSRDLDILKAELERAHGHKGYEKFLAHVTLGRFDPDKFDPRWRCELDNQPEAIREEVTWICLVESVPTESGTQYKILYRVKL